MGWRDINMSRRRPQPRVAFVAVEAGTDPSQAVVDKAAASAIAAATAQAGMGSLSAPRDFTSFTAGYVLGFTRHGAAKDGFDGEAGATGDAMAALVQALAQAWPPAWGVGFDAISFTRRETAEPEPRARLQLRGPGHAAVYDAGYLVGHLEALCGSRKLLRLARERLMHGGRDAGNDFLTDCDVAADPMQTRVPTLSLRFNEDERQVILTAFATLPE